MLRRYYMSTKHAIYRVADKTSIEDTTPAPSRDEEGEVEDPDPPSTFTFNEANLIKWCDEHEFDFRRLNYARWNTVGNKWDWGTFTQLPEDLKDPLKKERALATIRLYEFSAILGDSSPAARGSGSRSGPGLGGHFGPVAGSQGEEDAAAAGGGSASGSHTEAVQAPVATVSA
jgi:hypothetical protein